ncbi:hypothetical protein AK830_g4679 [Neonectria ditissima]|uniref:Uncharacterized protein n=1 Tax=Neonectria ditissima TaxID=78410 RepID=A0A0P7B627_9HYPO|nr:hypothetical protein AK830_g4679 [Neonectria ditissima]
MDASRRDTLQAHFASPNAVSRPILTSMNGDNSWLISFPRPSADRAARAYYHVVFEPWLAGPVTLLTSWIIGVALTAPPKISSIEDIEGAIRQIEEAAGTVIPAADTQSEGKYTGGIDSIMLGFHYDDHTNQATLQQFNENIPVIATPEAAGIVKSWGHFKTITTIQSLAPSAESWRDAALHPGSPVPSWLTPIRLPGPAVLNFGLAIIWTHATDDGGEVHEVIFNSPHGTRLDGGPIQAFLKAEPRTKKLAMLHGLKESHTAAIQTTYGVKGGLALYRRLGGVKYWVLSHNSTLKYSGIFMWLSWTVDTRRTMDWALEEEGKTKGDGEGELDRPDLVEVDNGGCFVLA